MSVRLTTEFKGLAAAGPKNGCRGAGAPQELLQPRTHAQRNSLIDSLTSELKAEHEPE